MRKTLFIILSSFLLNSCCINQMNIFGLGCKSPVEIPNVPFNLSELLSAKKDYVGLAMYRKIYDTTAIPTCSCYDLVMLLKKIEYKDKYWLVFKHNKGSNNETYSYIFLETEKDGDTYLNPFPKSMSEFPDFIVIERAGQGKKEFMLGYFDLDSIY